VAALFVVAEDRFLFNSENKSGISILIFIYRKGDRSVVGAVRPRGSQRDCNRASIRRVPRCTYSDVCSGSHHT
jgi:hypothetical protein